MRSFVLTIGEVFNSDRLYYEHHADGGDYLEQLAAAMRMKPDVKTRFGFFWTASTALCCSACFPDTDPTTVLIALRRSQGKSFSEISLEVGLSENTRAPAAGHA